MRLLKTVAFAAVLVLAAWARAETITVSAAISLKEVLADIAQPYQAETGEMVEFNLGASGTLAAQIYQGAPVDLFISAGPSQVDELVGAGLADGGTRTAIAGNRLVLIVPKSDANPPKSFQDLTDSRFVHVAIGDPKIVPAGQYAMQTLRSLRLDQVLASRLVMGQNVRQVLLYVSRAEAEAGVVYATDAAAAADAVKIAAVADEATHDPILYPAVIIKSGKTAAAAKFLQYLKSEKAQAIFAAHGFTAPAAAPAAATQKSGG
ncbi:MAG: molybdate ABC transporter substrate-binding protein [Tepidisphaeraceae bacterium]